MMVEIRDVGAGRYEVYAENRHWEAFTDAEQAEAVAGELTRRLSKELRVPAERIQVRHFRQVR